MPRKEKINAKTWERDRRNRMNTYFKTLADLLPPHQEGRKRNKVDILIHASKYIKELNSRTEELFNAHAGEAHKEELNRMKKLVTQLFSRTQLLTALLLDAGITVPAEPALEKISPLKWSNKINVEDGEKYLDRLTERKKPEKRKSKQNGFKVPSKQKAGNVVAASSKKNSDDKAPTECINRPIEDQENHVNSVINEINETRDTGTASNKSTNSCHSVSDSPRDVVTTSEPAVTKPSKGIRKLESRKKVKRKGKHIDAKLKKKKSNPSLAQSQSITNLLPGTVIWSAGKLMPLVTPITPLTSNILVSAQGQSTNPIILGNTQQNHQMIVMQPLSNRVQNSVVPLRNPTLMKAVQKVALNTVPSIHTSVGINSRDWASSVKNIIASTKIGGRKGILPKGKEITNTTMTYKVPIPAIHREPISTKSTESADSVTKIKRKTAKSKKSLQRDKPVVEIKESVNNSTLSSTRSSTDAPTTGKNSSPEITKNLEKSASGKKRKACEDTDISDVQQSKMMKMKKLPETCKSIENLRHVVERIGDDTSQSNAQSTEQEEKLDSPERENPTEKSPTYPESTGASVNTPEIENAVPSEECVSTLDKSTPLQPETPLNSKEDIVKECSSESPVIVNESSLKANTQNMTETQDDLSTSVEPSGGSSEPVIEQPTTTTALSEVDEAIVEAGVVTDKEKDVCDLGTQFDSLLRATEKTETKVDNTAIIDSAKIILNLDTNTTTTMKPETCPDVVETLNTEAPHSSEIATVLATSSAEHQVEEVSKAVDNSKTETLKSLSYSAGNSFIPIGNRAEGLHSDLSNDLFASLQVPSSSHNPESISPTAAFLMAFPLVSSLNGKTEVLEEEMKEDLKYHSQTPPMLLQIGTIEPNSFKVKNDSADTTIQSIADDKIPGNSHDRETTKNHLVTKISNEPATSKALPKVVNNEPIKERLYKVVQYPESTVNTSVNKDFAVASTSATSNIDTVTKPTCGIQSTSMIQNSTVDPNILTAVNTVPVGSSAKCDNSMRKCENNVMSSTCSKYDATNSGSGTVRPLASSSNNTDELPKYDSNHRYPDYVPGYANFTSAADSNTIRPTFAASKTIMANSSQAPTTLPVVNDSTVSRAYPSMRSQAVQSAYVAHTTGKEPQNSQHVYNNRVKDVIANSSESMSYPTFTPVSQEVFKDSYTTQSYEIQSKETGAQIPYQSYSLSTSKNPSSLDTNTTQHDRAYVTSRMNEPIISTGINVKETSPQNTFQNYPAMSLNKETTGLDQRNPENSGRLPTVENPRDEPGAQTSASYASFGSKDTKQNVHTGETTFPGKRNEAQTYIPYSRDPKKSMFDAGNSSVAQVSKTQHVQNSSISRYHHQLQQQSQRQPACVTSSNYGQSSTTSDNMIKSTTTVAHNSSNFSILSWTTFSPISGGVNNNNNSSNVVQYESGTDHVDETEGKTICENYNYAPLHKDSVAYGNMLPSDGFPTDSAIANVEKPSGKLVDDGLKQQNFDDPSKTKTVQPIPQQKPVRGQNQNTNTAEDYKFGSDNKSKSGKYPMGTAYTQTEFGTLEQQRLQQHSAKGHQTIPTKPEKPNYTMPTYDSHASFELGETNVQIKCNTEMYTGSNYKYADDKDVQLKYQPHVQRQASSLHHNNSSYNNVPKHTQQQQQQSQPPPPSQPQSQQQQLIPNKTKTIAAQQQLQQQPIRPPVNWMMTPEIKHNTNIADLILPPIGKELEFCQNNLFTQPPSYNQSTPNHQFYNNYDAAVSASHGFPNIPTLQSDPRRIADGFYTEEQPFSWSPTKNSQGIEHNQTIKTMDQQHVVVPSTLPTLVGDLALGTNISEKQSFLFGQMPPRNNKEHVQQTGKEKETNVVGRDYQAMLNTQNVQHTGQGSSFLSVSQLVEHEKAEKSHQQQNPHHSHNPHNHQPPQQTQQQPQQTRKHQRKNNASSPRATGKRQIETRKQTNVTEQQLHPQHTDDQKLPASHSFSDQSYHQPPQQQQQQQTQKYQQNDVHWRNRHCKSNYTAEALIGSNTSVHDANNQDKQLQPSTIKSFSTDYAQNKYPSGLSTTDPIIAPINYFSNSSDDPNSYGQVVNQNFNHSSYAYSPNTNIYPTTNFITNISNTPTSYMMPLHDNHTDFLEPNSFLLPNVTTNIPASSKAPINTTSSVSSSSSTRITTSSSAATNPKNHQQYHTGNPGKHQNCEKRNSYSTTSKKSKRKAENNVSMHNLDFPLTTVGSPLEDYHSHPHSHHHHHHHHHAHPSTFLAPPHANPLYQNHPHPSLATNANRVTRGVTATGNTAALSHHHPSGTSLTNFNLSTIFPEINDKVTGYKPPNVIPPGLSQSSNHATATYPQRANYATNNPLGHVPQVSESAQFTTDLPAPPPPGALHYKTT